LTVSFPYVLCQGYSPLDFTVLDPHWGTLADWQNTIDEIHARGMYFMADFTVGTMADLIGFEGCVNISLFHSVSLISPSFLNATAPFSLSGYDAVWKDPLFAPWGFEEYKDFQARDTIAYLVRGLC
jgi:alpha-1,3-glucan synthase